MRNNEEYTFFVSFHTLRLRQNGLQILKLILLNENGSIFIQISQNFLFVKVQMTIRQHWSSKVWLAIHVLSRCFPRATPWEGSAFWKRRLPNGGHFVWASVCWNIVQHNQRFIEILMSVYLCGFFWSINPYSSGLLYCHWGILKITPVPVK